MVVFAVVLLLFAVGAMGYALNRRKRIHQKFVCPEGTFRITGQKERFKVCKDQRFVFEVVDGQIVSFTDRDVSNHEVRYGGGEDGTV